MEGKNNERGVLLAGHFGVSVCPLNMYSKLVTVECCRAQNMIVLLLGTEKGKSLEGRFYMHPGGQVS